MNTNVVQYSIAEQTARQAITSAITQALNTSDFNDTLEIVYPPDSAFGDFSVSCFAIAKQLQRQPVDLARDIAEKIKPDGVIDHAQPAGPYINIFVNQAAYTKLVLSEIVKAKGAYGKNKQGTGKRVMVEYFSPNTNKPLTIGHVRNICLGASLVNLLKFTGHKVITGTLYNDRGIAIAKTILGYQKWGNNKTPVQARMKSDHFVGSFYVQFAQAEKQDKNLEQEAQRVLQAWEHDDRMVRKTWGRLMQWVLQGFKITIKKLGVEGFNEEYYESEYYHEGKKVVENGLAQGIFKRGSDGVIFAPLEKYGLADKVLLRPDDTSLYVTQDLYLAYLKDRHCLDSSIYVVGSEQDLYFKQLFKILELLGFSHAKDYHHLSYGMVRLPYGKIKSREGLVQGTAADELIAMLETLAREEVHTRFTELSATEVEARASAIALSALKFYILQVNPKTTIVFDPKQSLAFNGKTGPYVQYTYARIASIFAKEKVKLTTRIDVTTITTDEEFALVKQLARFPLAVSTAVADYNPAEVASYIYELAQQFSLFYEKHPVLKADEKTKNARLLLLKDVQIVLGTGLMLLGIQPIEQM